MIIQGELARPPAFKPRNERVRGRRIPQAVLTEERGKATEAIS